MVLFLGNPNNNIYFIVMNTVSCCKLLLFYIISTVFTSSAQEPPISSRQKNCHYLYNYIPDDLKDRATYYRSLLEQKDPSSCGQRTLFHALTFQEAVIKKRQGFPIDTSLRWLLTNSGYLQQVYSKANRSILEEYPDYDFKKMGTHGNQLLAASDKFPQLKGKMLPIHLYNRYLYTGQYTQKGTYYTLLSQSWEFRSQMNQLKYPLDIVHFPCLLDQHWILASVTLDDNYNRRVFFIDSCNTSFGNYYLSTLIQLFTHEVQNHN